MHVRFWGVRGSIPSPLSDDEIRQKIRLIITPQGGRSAAQPEPSSYGIKPASARGATYGGNTSCVELRQDGTVLSLDAGSGIRLLGLRLSSEGVGFEDEPFYLLVSHYHWDHIQGFPFFEPCYRSGNHISIYSAMPGLEEAFRTQMSPPFFPRSLDELPAQLTFHQLAEDETAQLGAFRVRSLKLAHPNGAAGYRVEGGGASVVYLTDTELRAAGPELLKATREFCWDADLVIADTQFDRDEATRKADWGHSSIFEFIDLVAGTPVVRLALFHYDPKYADETIDQIYYEALKLRNSHHPDWSCELLAAHEGLELSLPRAPSAAQSSWTPAPDATAK